MFLNRCISNVLTLTQEKKKKGTKKRSFFLIHTYTHTHTLLFWFVSACLLFVTVIWHGH